MTYAVTGLSPEPFRSLFGLSAAELAARGVIRQVAGAEGRYPCRVTLEDARPGEMLLLLNHESHAAATPYRSAYAIFVREGAVAAARHVDELPPVLRGRPIALRIFNADGMLIGARLALADDVEAGIEAAFDDPEAAYLHAHNAAHGCFAARIDRA